MTDHPTVAAELAALTRAMLESARLAQWDRVEAQERQRHQLMEKLRPNVPLDMRQRQALTERLEEAAALNAELVALSDRACAALRQAAGELQRGRRANLAYHGLK